MTVIERIFEWRNRRIELWEARNRNKSRLQVNKVIFKFCMNLKSQNNKTHKLYTIIVYANLTCSTEKSTLVEYVDLI